MEFKDNWRPRIDNVDDADASAVNEIAEAVISNEERIKTIEKNTYSKKEANETFANALKGSVTGSAVRIDDASPIEHEMKVKVSGVDDVGAVKLQRYGKNLLDASKFNAANTTINGITFEQMGEGKVHVYGTIADNSKTILYASNSIRAANAKYIPSGVYSVAKHVVGGRSVYMLARLSDANNKFLVNLQNKNQSITTGGYLVGYSISVDRKITTTIDLVVDLQVEQGATATEYAPYIEPTEYPVNADGAVDSLTPLYQTTTLMTDTDGAVIDVEYNRDLNKAFATLEGIVNALIV